MCIVCDGKYEEKPVLNCDGCTKVTEINVSPFHKEIYCSNCPNLVQIISIETKHNINFKLRILICKKCPKLYQIGILNQLNNLETLDCSGCTKLRDITIIGDNMRKFISNSCTNLYSIKTSAIIISCRKCLTLTSISITVSYFDEFNKKKYRIDIRKCPQILRLYGSTTYGERKDLFRTVHFTDPVPDPVPQNIIIIQDLSQEFLIDDSVTHHRNTFQQSFPEKQLEIMCYSIQKYKKELGIEWEPDLPTLRKFSFEEVNKNGKVKGLFFKLYEEKLAVVFDSNYITTNPESILDFEYLFCNLNEETFLNIKNHIQKGNIFLQKAEDMTKERLIDK